jgi:hypothetical protein
MERWFGLGNGLVRQIAELYRIGHRDFLMSPRPAALEWGPGGGANLYAMANMTDCLYGVDISELNLNESARQLMERPAADFTSVLFTGEASQVLESVCSESIDLCISTACFQHFPNKQYGRDALEVMYKIAAPKALGLVQIRFDNGDSKFDPKETSSYAETHVYQTSYMLDEFWEMLSEVGFRPLMIPNVAAQSNYASFYFSRP